MSATLIQNPASAFNSTSGTVTTAKPAQNDLLVAWANSDNTVGTPTDNGSNSWTSAVSLVDDNGCYTWYRVATSTDASSLTTVTFSPTTSDSITCGVMEWSGCVTASPLDKSGSANQTSPSGPFTSSPAVTALSNTGTNGDLVLAFAMEANSTGGVSSSGPSWTNSYTDTTPTTYQWTTNPSECTFIGYLNQSVAASTNTVCSWTTSQRTSTCLIISFKLAAVAGSGIPDLIMAQMRGNY